MLDSNVRIKGTSLAFATMKETSISLSSGIFFATSHGNSGCEGVGDRVKRLARRASLQRPYEGQIATPVWVGGK